MADEGYWICFLTDTLSPGIEDDIVSSAEMLGITPEETVDGEIRLQVDSETTVAITINVGDDWEWNDPQLILSFWTKSLKTDSTDNRRNTSENVQECVEKILDLVVELVRLTSPEYAWSMLNVGKQPDAGLRPMERPIAHNISRLSWVTVFSESVAADFGGRDRIVETPAWRVETLDSSHIVVVTTDNPVDPTFEPEGDPEEFLFGDNEILD